MQIPHRDDDTAPYVLDVRPEVRQCEVCGEQHRLTRIRQRDLADLPYGDHPVILRLTEGRTYCRRGKRYETYYWPEPRFYTRALARYLQRRMGTEAHRRLAERVGLSPSQVRKAQHEWLPKRSLPTFVEHLGLDDLYILKQRHLVAIDVPRQRLLALQPVAMALEGQADQFNFDTFLAELPDAGLVSLDMHAEQMQAARRRWPEATLVIDKRHLLQLIDRDLLSMVHQLITGRWEQLGDPIGQRRALRMFGAAAYPYLALRTQVLRRQAHLTPAELASWTLIRREGQAGRQLWEAYQFREALYQLYDPALPPRLMAPGIERWAAQVEKWQTQLQSADGYSKPLGRIAWALRVYKNECLAYAQTQATNAATEAMNARIRRLLRRGHRYNPATLVSLVNDSEPSSDLPAQEVHLAPERWIRADLVPVTPVAPLFAEEAEEVERAEEVTAPALPVPVESPPVSRQTPRRPSGRTPYPRMHPELNLPPAVWKWLHSRAGRGLQAPRWAARILEQADDRASWIQLNSGRWDSKVSAHTLRLWRATVLNAYLQQHPKDLGIKARELYPTLTELRLTDLSADILEMLTELWRTQATQRFYRLQTHEEKLLTEIHSWATWILPEAVELWQQLQPDGGGLVTDLLAGLSEEEAQKHALELRELQQWLTRLDDAQVAVLLADRWTIWRLLSLPPGPSALQEWIGLSRALELPL